MGRAPIVFITPWFAGKQTLQAVPSVVRQLKVIACFLALTANHKRVGTVGERRGGKVSAQLREDHHVRDRLIRRVYCEVE